MDYTYLVFTVYEAKILLTLDVKEPYTIWTKIAKADTEFEDLDWDRLDESKGFQEFDDSIYYMLDQDEEIREGLELDEKTYVVEYQYLGERVFKLDPMGNVVERKEVA